MLYGGIKQVESILWTVDFNTGARMYVSATTILNAVKNAVWGYNKDMNEKIAPKNIVSVRKGKIDD